MKVISSFSGGKDSHACLINAVERFGKKVVAVFCDTGHEHVFTYAHIKSVCEKLGVELVVVKSTKYDNFQDLAIKKGRYPSTKARFCTEELKMKPMIDYILSLQDDVLIFEGKRRDESEARSGLHQECTYFKYYFQPYKWSIKEKFKHLYVNVPIGQADMFGVFQIGDIPISEIPTEHKTPVYFTYRKKDVMAFAEKYLHDLWRPVVDWTAQMVINYILEKGHKPNPLYFKGLSRVGCFPCVMASHAEVWIIINDFPTDWWLLKQKERESGRTFFPPNYIPSWACANGEYVTLEDVERYLRAKKDVGELFEEKKGESRCMSFYHLCD